MIVKLERKLSTELQNKDQTQNPTKNENNNKHWFKNRTTAIERMASEATVGCVLGPGGVGGGLKSILLAKPSPKILLLLKPRIQYCTVKWTLVDSNQPTSCSVANIETWLRLRLKVLFRYFQLQYFFNINVFKYLNTELGNIILQLDMMFRVRFKVGFYS